MHRCLFTVCSWPGVAAKALEGQGIPWNHLSLFWGLWLFKWAWKAEVKNTGGTQGWGLQGHTRAPTHPWQASIFKRKTLHPQSYFHECSGHSSLQTYNSPQIAHMKGRTVWLMLNIKCARETPLLKFQSFFILFWHWEIYLLWPHSEERGEKRRSFHKIKINKDYSLTRLFSSCQVNKVITR